MAAKGNDNSKTAAIIVIGVALMYDKIFGKSESQKKSDEEEKRLLDVPQDKNPTLQNYKVPAKKGYLIYRKNIGSIIGPAVVAIKKAIGRGIYISQTDASNIIKEIKVCRTKTEVNILYRTYNTLTKRDLTTDLQVGLTAENKERLYSFINSLPNYIKG